MFQNLVSVTGNGSGLRHRPYSGIRPQRINLLFVFLIQPRDPRKCNCTETNWKRETISKHFVVLVSWSLQQTRHRTNMHRARFCVDGFQQKHTFMRMCRALTYLLFPITDDYRTKMENCERFEALVSWGCGAIGSEGGCLTLIAGKGSSK